MPDLTFKKRIQEEKEDARFEKALKELRGDDENTDMSWITDDDLRVDLNELFSE